MPRSRSAALLATAHWMPAMTCADGAGTGRVQHLDPHERGAGRHALAGADRPRRRRRSCRRRGCRGRCRRTAGVSVQVPRPVADAVDEVEHLAVVELLVCGVDAGVDDRDDEVVGHSTIPRPGIAVEIREHRARARVTPKAACAESLYAWTTHFSRSSGRSGSRASASICAFVMVAAKPSTIGSQASLRPAADGDASRRVGSRVGELPTSAHDHAYLVVAVRVCRGRPQGRRRRLSPLVSARLARALDRESERLRTSADRPLRRPDREQAKASTASRDDAEQGPSPFAGYIALARKREIMP